MQAITDKGCTSHNMTPFLNSIPIKHENCESKKPSYIASLEHIIPEHDLTYVLPHMLVEKAAKVIRMKATVTPKKRADEPLEGDASQPIETDAPRAPLDVEHGIKVVSIGVFTAKDIDIMRLFHKLKVRFSDLEKALMWITKLSFFNVDVSLFHIDFNDCMNAPTMKFVLDLTSKLQFNRAIPGALGSIQPYELLNFTQDEWLCDACMLAAMGTFSGSNFFPVSSLFNGFPTFPQKKDYLLSLNVFTTDSKPILFFPINLRKSHWCGIIVDKIKKKVLFYDSLHDKNTYNHLLLLFAQVIQYSAQTILPLEIYEKLYCTKATRQPVSDDNNCGIFVLTFFECYLRRRNADDDFIVFNHSCLKYLRFRYMYKIVNQGKCNYVGNNRK